MNVSILVAIITAFVTATGWLVSHILLTRREDKNRQTDSSLKFIDRQLEELYGPLAFLMWEGDRAFKDLLETLGRPYVFSGDRPLPEAELKLWLFWLDQFFFPKNEKIRELLMNNTHLIEGSEMPASYVRFLEHYNSWRIEHLRWKQEGVPYSWHSKMNWPLEFSSDVLNTFKTLKARQAVYKGKVFGDRT
ncbi:MAG TPA: hypothetical protein VE961_05665 [Pyrinomonadaceae bacterium]|nr:hypothetical protein [Pyrinomonadaceae bacterium]